MGKATTLIGVNIFISIIATLVMLGVQSIDPTSSLLTSNALRGDFNVVQGEINQTTPVWQSNKDYTSGQYFPTREATGSPSATSTQFPDWTYSSLQWVTGNPLISFVLNVVGAPYTLAQLISDSSASTIVGVGFSMFNLFIIVMWIFGKVD